MRLVDRLDSVLLRARGGRLVFDRRLRREMSPARAISGGNLAVLLLAFALFVWMAS
jgi:hypothetical protein